jgi:HD-like signal output (HDOD) protein
MNSAMGRSPDLLHPAGSVPTRPVLDIDVLPPLPEVAWRILEMTSDLYLGVGELSDLIARDQALTARVLRIANSAFFRRTREIRTVRDAAVLLGNRKIRGVVIAASLGGVIRKTPQGRQLWEHALGAALAAREIAARTRLADPDDAFVAGLLHDVGKILFDLQFPQAFLEAVACAEANPDLSTLEAERAYLGWTHTEAGELVAEAWNLPDAIAEVVTCHHEPERSVLFHELSVLVQASNWLCHSLGIGPVRRVAETVDAEAIWKAVGLEPDGVGALAEDFLIRLSQDKELFGFH